MAIEHTTKIYCDGCKKEIVGGLGYKIVYINKHKPCGYSDNYYDRLDYCVECSNKLRIDFNMKFKD